MVLLTRLKHWPTALLLSLIIFFSAKVFYAYVDLHDWSGLEVDTALSDFFSGFRAPGEASVIDRMIVSGGEFASAFPYLDLALFNLAGKIRRALF